MNINNSLAEWINKSKLLRDYATDSIRENMIKALSDIESIRYAYSIEAIKQLWELMPEFSYLVYYDNLAEFEFENKFYNNYRDHVTHMLKVFILGLYIYENVDMIKKKFSDRKEQFFRTWLIISLCHDVGYFFETKDGTRDGEDVSIALQLMNTFLSCPLSTQFPNILSHAQEKSIIQKNKIFINQVTSLSYLENEVDWNTFQELGKLSDSQNSDDKNVVYEYYALKSKKRKGRSFYDHGICSALMLLYLDKAYQDYIQHVSEIYKDDLSDLACKIRDITELRGKYNDIIKTSAKAIALHNISKKCTEAEEKELIDSGIDIRSFVIDIKKLPYAYLLKVCDEFSCWDRQLYRPLKTHEVELKIYGKDLDVAADNKKMTMLITKNSIEKTIKDNLNDIILPNIDKWVNIAISSKTIELKENVKLKSRKEKNSSPIWLPDAENATGLQTRFNTYTSTSTVASVIERDSSYWGIASVKGIGKTFVLQIKRVRAQKDFLCFPYVNEPGPSNNWATESFVLDEAIKTNLYGKDLSTIATLWKISIECRLINAILKYYSANNAEIYTTINNVVNDYSIDEDLLRYITGPEYDNIGIIIGNILFDRNWANHIKDNIVGIKTLASKIAHIVIEETDKKAIIFFIDKLDQSIGIPTAEPAPEDCSTCKKLGSPEKCLNPKKSDQYCGGKGGDTCQEKKYACCYGCEKFEGSHSNHNNRVFPDTKVKRLTHVNYWQYLQLALVEAVYKIKTEYGGKIRVYYTIRQEATDCDDNVLHEQKKKIGGNLKILYYTKEEQKRIFYDCINAEQSKFLFDASYKKIKDYEYAFLGVNQLCHPYVIGVNEQVFDSIYRHSFDRTRDIQEFGQALGLKVKELRELEDENKRAELVKKTIETTAGHLAIGENEGIGNSLSGSYYSEKMDMLPEYWANRDNFFDLLMHIDRNLLFSNEITSICSKVNNCATCDGSGKKCSEKGCYHHPFSMLYRLGMLGLLTINDSNNEKEEQKFVDSRDVSYIHEKDELSIDDKTCYIIHPALTKGIELIKKGNILHFTKFVLGKGITVDKLILRMMFEDHNIMDYDTFTRRYFYLPDG